MATERETNEVKTPPAEARWYRSRAAYGVLTAVIAAGAAGVTALLMNISERKAESRTPFVRVVEVKEDDTDPAKWGKNWPAQYDSYQRTALRTATRYGGHAGSEALPEEKIARDPWLKRMFAGVVRRRDTSLASRSRRRGVSPATGFVPCSDRTRGTFHPAWRR
jgi:hypothetical protein